MEYSKKKGNPYKWKNEVNNFSIKKLLDGMHVH